MESSTTSIETTISPGDRIYNLIVERDENSWKELLFEIIKTEKMDPWDIDVSLLAKKYLNAIKKMKEMDFRLSGKMILASALLLNFKAKKLFNEDIDKLDNLINLATSEDDEYNFEGLADFFSLEDSYSSMNPEEEAIIIPKIQLKTPQPRMRKLTINDLVEALDDAMKVENRRKNRLEMIEKEKPIVQVKKFDLKEKAISVYNTVVSLFKKKDKVFLDDLIQSPNKEDIIYSFVPLLHLDFSRMINMSQKENFGAVEIEIIKKIEDQREIESSIKI
ncbi:MAG: segregation and condensation protein [Candidatus Woesearchaeota archaeon]|nr:segregation and condensation protein [Candidatus Woesearchaeota archaeon]